MKIKPILLGAVILLAVFVRFYKLDTSSHFMSDESRDLVNIHQIFVEHKITLVGPISDDRSHVFSSLTYYMLLPFAVLFNFDPLGTVTGAAVWGCLTWLVMIIFIHRKFPRFTIPAAILGAVWFPLVQTSRWPWNPNLMIFWIFCGLLLADSPKKPLKILSGLMFGMAIHHHYLAIVPAGLMVIWKRDWKLALGIALAVLPFIIFDLRHPPGIFILRSFDYNRGILESNIPALAAKLPAVFGHFAGYVFGTNLFAGAGLLTVFLLAVWDLVRKSAGRVWLFLWLIPLVTLIFYSWQPHYSLPAIPFLLTWVFVPRPGWGNKLARLNLLLLITGSLLILSGQFSQPDWQGNLQLLRGGTKIIREQITVQKLKNPNLAVIGSPDIYPDGKKYRGLLLVDNIRVKPVEEYETSDNLFVITVSGENSLRKDPALEMTFFRKGPVAGSWKIPGTDWKVIQFNRY